MKNIFGTKKNAAVSIGAIFFGGIAVLIPLFIGNSDLASASAVGFCHFSALLGISYFVRRYKWVVYSLFIVLPIVSLPIWLASGQQWFMIAKTYTIIAYLLWIQFTRDVKRLNASKVMIYGIYILLIFNIAEAMLQDLQNGYYLNIISGLLLCVTIPFVNRIKIDTTHKWNDLSWDMSHLWIVFYAAWNMTFVFSTFPYGGLTHVAVNMAPLVVGLINRKIWLQTRVITLAAHVMIRIYFVQYNEMMYIDVSKETSWFDPALTVMHVIVLSLGLITLIETVLRKKRRLSV